jgi:uncharacterized membrane protein YfcA
MSPRLVRLAVIATLAGAFSALFGVGGGTVIVPLLILWFAYGEREATGTSMAAIVGIAGMAAVLQAASGNVDIENGLLIALPAIFGALAGTALQQRIPERAVSVGFGLFLLGSAAVLIF